MKKHYPWLWFDADNTLFDYDRAEGSALKNTFGSLDLRFEDDYLDTYQHINRGLWQALEKQEITSADLRVRRFELLLEAVQLTGSADQMSTSYIEQLGLRAELMDGAYEVLEALHSKCKFAIVTNGLQAVQRGRLACSTIKDFISELIISEEVGAAKPHAAFFDEARTRTGHPDKSDVLIIGDSLTSDIRGGVGCGIDTCWYNPKAEARPVDLPITYEIRHLHELLELLD
ncbi:MAG: YjjG family noncanonical pyrimidine nucleotidase [Chloroflexota bacterium]|nr:YjjG family noncanonical pyrimidine nucleotidase [Chloroflexota bacterium]